jgi:hypothetical protein
LAGSALDSFVPEQCYNPAQERRPWLWHRNFHSIETVHVFEYRRGETMGDISGPLAYLLLLWGLITVVLVVLLIYRATLSSREDDQLYLNKAEVSMMGGPQAVLISKMNRLSKPIVALAVLSGILLLASASLWVWIGFNTH